MTSDLIVPEQLPTWVPDQLTAGSPDGWQGSSVRGHGYRVTDVEDVMIVARRARPERDADQIHHRRAVSLRPAPDRRRPAADGSFRFHPCGADFGGMCTVGTFSERATISQRSVVKVDEWPSLETAVVAGCGVPTGWASANYAGGVRAIGTVAIYRIGGIGINAVQGAAHASAKHVVLDPLAFKRDTAMTFDATHASATAEEAAAKITKLTWGQMADQALITVGSVDEDVVTTLRHRSGQKGLSRPQRRQKHPRHHRAQLTPRPAWGRPGCPQSRDDLHWRRHDRNHSSCPVGQRPQERHPVRRPDHRRGHCRPIPALPPARAGTRGASDGSRRQRRRHLVLEPLSRRARRFAVARVSVLVLPGAEQRVELERTISRTAGNRALPEFRGRSLRPRSEEHTSELQSPLNLVCRL